MPLCSRKSWLNPGGRKGFPEELVILLSPIPEGRAEVGNERDQTWG